MFYWGNSVSSMQTEGGWNEGGKSLSVYDIVEPGENRSDWHFANDNYHHYEMPLLILLNLLTKLLVYHYIHIILLQ